ncbi:DUF7619 domain-containing protein [Flavobacterium dankookense]|uniref:Putative repeat protein (TIGR01451 family)/predicted secreted protein (Por secretion system target) n=1 Tax=Flavobacterium dankookense TaxID=706186 RepID=A0A4R6Q7J3_9FLAO|nr:T9SS type A sorting domain-containing protein [Flavobacterium dankookense]TDP57997.1 putative repeat protein (TIGR01451 family)/predicted secreted protein (Por secretion system target) [Flavobacterium dankookense]
MKKFYTILVLVFVATSNAQIVNIPDANFKDYLLFNVDTNNDGEIQESEAAARTFPLILDDLSISDLTGINAFINIQRLECNNNQLTFLNISSLTNLRILKCSNNQLTSIIFPSTGSFDYLECDYNQLTVLDFPETFSVHSLNASHNQLTNVNINFTSFVEGINLSYNNLTSFTASNTHFIDGFNISNNQLSNLVLDNVRFDYLFINNNNLSSINVIGTARVDNIMNIRNNQFSDLDLTGFQNILNPTLYLGNNIVDVVPSGNEFSNVEYESENTSFDLTGFYSFANCDPTETGSVTITNSPNLETITIKNGFNHTFVTCSESVVFQIRALRLNISNCPNLSHICVDELEQPYIQASINQLGLGNQVQVNSYCSFTPGGEFCTIQGTTRLDNDSNGCDANDIIFPNQQFTATNGTVSGLFISNESGNYSIPVQQGTHTITPVLENPSYFNVSPASITVSFPSAASPFTQDFCVTANGVKNDVEVTIIPIEVARPGFDAEYKIIYKNKGNQVANGNVSFGFDDAVMDLVSATPVNDNGATNSLSWNYTNLNPFETREIDLVFNINSPMEIPEVNGDDVLDYTATIVGATDETPNDNTFTLNQTVVNSFDPNDKTCLEGTTITPSMVGQYVHYVIRFENTGTFAAQNIVVKDMIDTTKFDTTTLVPQRSSHDFVTRITNTNKVEFIFENINLPFDDANNDGYVAFKIKTKPTLVLGDTFSNEASIYFDYNFPIITEPAVTTIAALSNQDFDFGSYFTLYPNPAKEVLNFEVKNEIGVKSIQVYNSLGQIVMAVTNASTTRSIDVASLNAGAYFIKVTTDRGSANSKFIKE